MNWYSDLKNRAFSRILTTLFPEQTQTLPRIFAWSIVFLTDLIVGIGTAVHYGLLDFDRYNSASIVDLIAGVLVVGIIGIFWLQGFVWYRLVNYFKERNRIEP